LAAGSPSLPQMADTESPGSIYVSTFRGRRVCMPAAHKSLRLGLQVEFRPWIRRPGNCVQAPGEVLPATPKV
jgi:hypothetical protein